MEELKFNFEKLEVWQKSVIFAKKIIEISERMNTERKHYRLIEQLEAASTSIAMNIAEGKGRYSRKEFVNFLYIARGSLFETITLLTIFNENKWIEQKQVNDLKYLAAEISKMISGLICSIKSSII